MVSRDRLGRGAPTGVMVLVVMVHLAAVHDSVNAQAVNQIVEFVTEEARLDNRPWHNGWIELAGTIVLEFRNHAGFVSELRLESIYPEDPQVIITGDPEAEFEGQRPFRVGEIDICMRFNAIVEMNGVPNTVRFDNYIGLFPECAATVREYPRFEIRFMSGPQLIMTLHPSPEHADRFFQRGDPSDDGAVDLSDATAILQFLFLAGAAPSCEDAADTNDDGVLNLTDAVVVLEHLFLGGDPESLGGPVPCWIDFTPDELTCDGQEACRR